MADTPEKQPIEAAGDHDQPTFAKDEVSVSDADMALAAMGYKPVSLLHFQPACLPVGSSHPTCGSDEKRPFSDPRNHVDTRNRCLRENSDSGLPSASL